MCASSRCLAMVLPSLSGAARRQLTRGTPQTRCTESAPTTGCYMGTNKPCCNFNGPLIAQTSGRVQRTSRSCTGTPTCASASKTARFRFEALGFRPKCASSSKIAGPQYNWSIFAHVHACVHDAYYYVCAECVYPCVCGAMCVFVCVCMRTMHVCVCAYADAPRRAADTQRRAGTLLLGFRY